MLCRKKQQPTNVFSRQGNYATVKEKKINKSLSIADNDGILSNYQNIIKIVILFLKQDCLHKRDDPVYFLVYADLMDPIFGNVMR